MSIRHLFKFALSAFLLTSTSIGRPESSIDEIKEHLDSAAEALDNLRSMNDEFGEVVMSYPILGKSQSSNNFDLKKDSKEYLEEAKKISQGGAAHMLMMANVIAGSLQVKNNSMIGQQFQTDLQQHQSSESALDQYKIKKMAICDERKAQYIDESDPDKKETKLKAWDDCLTNLKPVSATAPGRDATTPVDPKDPKFADEAKATLKDSTLVKAPGTLLPSDLQLSISNRDALHIAAGDKAVETAYRILGDPAMANQFKGKVLLIASSMVSVNPGWRTREGFFARLSAEMKIEYTPASYQAKQQFINQNQVPCDVRKMVKSTWNIVEDKAPQDSKKTESTGSEGANTKNAKQYIDNCNTSTTLEYFPNEYILSENEDHWPHPLIAAVSPLTASQTLDLSNSERNVMEFSLALAGILKEMNLEGQASIFEQFVRSNQNDSRTRTVNTIVNSYSINGGQFGYQIAPQFVGLDVQGENEKSANLLQPQSFPVLLLIGLDQNDLNLRIKKCVDKDPDGENSCKQQGSGPDKWKIMEPHLAMKQNFDWRRADSYGFWGTIGNFFFDPGYYFFSKDKSSDQMNILYELNKKYIKFQDDYKNLQNKANDFCKENKDNEKCNELKGEMAILSRSNNFLTSKFWTQKWPLASISIQDIPSEILFPTPQEDAKPKPQPYITEVIPNKIRLTRTGSSITADNSEILILGSNLKQLDTSKIEVVPQSTDSFKVSSAPDDNKIRIVATVAEGSPISFKIPIKPDNKNFLFTAPIKVEIIDVKPQASPTTDKPATNKITGSIQVPISMDVPRSSAN
ncbi:MULTISPECIES: hypothetical protein [Methylomonas]|uniref:IPT/TIG domain-containing protein n=1 Tax=Methylomonas koyamae TaxID=702114 RepID=A0A177NFY0_9GAMM|nr:hypothetical protein [Methylomonas koyamae]OAI16986.1 hypothetical protein A1355_08820 [Methylomonas koyamae]